MKKISRRFPLSLFALVVLGALGNCQDSGHDLATTRDGSADPGTRTGGAAMGGVPASGGVITGGTGGGGAGTGTGGAPGKDAGAIDAPADGAAVRDTSDDGSGCGPGYPVGSRKDLGDGCNTCVCMAGGAWGCTTAACQMDAAVASDAGAGACAQLKTQAACDARTDCHSVFYDPGTCGCASPGCCAKFNACADGAKALCVPPATILCDRATPFCESPYVLSYTTWCYEGCVPQSKCAL